MNKSFEFSGVVAPRARISHKFLILLLIFSVGLFLSGCKSHKKNNKIETIQNGVVLVNPQHDSKEIGERIAAEAMTWLGTSYGYGCQEKGKKTDCSGLVMVVYLQLAEVKLPRNSAEQADFCKTLKEKEIKPGDLVFFATGSNPNRISHVGVMIDSKRFVHASSSKGVIISDMDTPYYIRKFKKYGRVPL